LNPPAAHPIRILRIIARLNVGGPAIHVALLTQKFGAPGYESRLVCGSIDASEGDMSYYAAERGVEPVYIAELGREINPLSDLRTIWKLYRLIKAYQPDVVHTHTAKAGITGRVAAWLAGVTVIVHTFHGHVFQGYFGALKTRVFIAIEQIAARLSDTLITLTEGLRRELADEYRIARKSRITVLPLGLDLAPFAEMPRKSGGFRAAWSIPPDAPLIGIVGRLVPIKNHDLFLEAARRLREQHPTARFVIIGDGETRAQVEAQVEALGLRESVIFTGWLRDLAPAYSDMDALVISSLNEGTPVSIIEALTAGCPVVATAVGGLPDLLEGGRWGRLVPSGDAAALSEALDMTLRQPPSMTEARQVMQNRYGIDRLVSDLDSLYRALLDKKRSRRAG
jgi:glycosyltransferase involved in cell wall biosynthesis